MSPVWMVLVDYEQLALALHKLNTVSPLDIVEKTTEARDILFEMVQGEPLLPLTKLLEAYQTTEDFAKPLNALAS